MCPKKIGARFHRPCLCMCLSLILPSCLHSNRVVRRKARLTLLTIPVALLMGEDERPAGPFNDMLGVVVETRAGARGATKAVHDDAASTTRAAGRADERTIFGERRLGEWVVGKRR